MINYFHIIIYMINNIEHFGGIFGKADNKSEEKKELTSSQLRLLNLNCKDKFGIDYKYNKETLGWYDSIY